MVVGAYVVVVVVVSEAVEDYEGVEREMTWKSLERRQPA